MATKTEQALADAIQTLLDAGFALDGQTRKETVRIPTANSPVYGMSGGELAKLGGRQRFAKAGTNIKATVGPRTTALYRIEGAGLAGVRGIATLNTNDTAGVRAAVAAL